MVRRYGRSLADETRALLERYRPVDWARKVVGVGSVGTDDAIVLLRGDSDSDPLFLQVKEAQASVVERFAGRSRYRNHGQRVVAGQRLTQAASDIFLGWTRIDRRDYYVRQLRNMKRSVSIDRLSPKELTQYAGACGEALAGGHARWVTASRSARTSDAQKALTARSLSSPSPTQIRPTATTHPLPRRRAPESCRPLRSRRDARPTVGPPARAFGNLIAPALPPPRRRPAQPVTPTVSIELGKTSRWVASAARCITGAVIVTRAGPRARRPGGGVRCGRAARRDGLCSAAAAAG